MEQYDRCARALTEQDFIATIGKKVNNITSLTHIHGPDHFSWWPKMDNITNDNYEAFNTKILYFRWKAIMIMLEEVRCYIMKIMVRQNALSRYIGNITPNQQSKLRKEKKEGNNWTPI